MRRPLHISCLVVIAPLLGACSEITHPADANGDGLRGSSEVTASETATGTHRLELEVLGAVSSDAAGPYEALPEVPVELLEIVPIPPEDQVTDSAGVRAVVEFVPQDTVRTDADGLVTFDVAPGTYGVQLETRCHGTAYLYTPTTDGPTSRYELRLSRRWQPGGLVPEGC